MRLATAISLGVYVGIGAFTHALLVGTTFSAANVLGWACLIAWPAIWFVVLLLFAFAAALLVMAGLALDNLWGRLPFIARRRRRSFSVS